MKLDDTDPWISRAMDHLAMAIRLRGTAAKLKSVEGRSRLTQLAALYEQLSLCFLEESCVVPADRRRDESCTGVDRRKIGEVSVRELLRAATPMSPNARTGMATRQRH